MQVSYAARTQRSTGDAGSVGSPERGGGREAEAAGAGASSVPGEPVALGDELANRRSKQAARQGVAQLDEEKKHLEFMNQLKKYDQDLSPTDDKDSDSGRETLDDLFPDDQDEPGPIQPPHSSSSAAAVAAQQGGYEIPARLRTLHNLVIQCSVG
ncbi:hypothetical protein AALO_G00000560 [Alosa alosa]|uniref:Uncharacterized protein n=1 Tax=Alosa alosa TaxID=278164 RepID=A0AAV6HDJ0_9TELE|nr:hypothetical protein AALO_G00000560 [Alosa alosa]